MLSNRRSFLKQIGFSSAGLSLMSALPKEYISKVISKGVLPRSTPEEQGVSSVVLNAFLDEVEKSKIQFHSIMVVRHGHVIAEGWWTPYAAPLKHALYSLSKSFTSTAIGLLVSDKKLDIEAPVISFFPNEVPAEVSPNLAAMKVKHLLTMSSGHVKDTIQPMRKGTESWVKTFFSLPVEREPGSYFLYNTGATYVLSAIAHRLTGQSLLQYLRPRILDPLGITGEDWETDPQGINTGGYGLRVRTEDIAKFGQLYLQKGKWEGKQLLSPEWIEEATRSQIVSNSSNPSKPRDQDDWAQGYGYQFWRCRPGGYRADGAFGQFSMVMPEYDAVIAITSESFSMQKSMDLVWSYLLPAMDKSKVALPVNNTAATSLRKKLKSLSLEPPKHASSSALISKISNKEFMLADNEFKAKSFTLHFRDNKCIFTLNGADGPQHITCGVQTWVSQKNENKGTPFPVEGRMEVPTAIAGSVTWQDNSTLLMTLQLIESAHSNGVTFVFGDKNDVTLKFHSSISQNNPNSTEKRADIRGTMKS